MSEGEVNEAAVDDVEEEAGAPAEEEVRGELGVEDAVAPKGFTRLHTPTKEEFDRHCLTHLPYRSWCPICVQAKRKNTAHRRVAEQRGISVFSIDYVFLNGRDSLSNPVIVMTDSESGGIWAIPVKRKGNYSEYVSRRIATTIEKVGYARCVC